MYENLHGLALAHKRSLPSNGLLLPFTSKGGNCVIVTNDVWMMIQSELHLSAIYKRFEILRRKDPRGLSSDVKEGGIVVEVGCRLPGIMDSPFNVPKNFLVRKNDPVLGVTETSQSWTVFFCSRKHEVNYCFNRFEWVYEKPDIKSVVRSL
jgi:hypothetical protein